MNHLLQQIENYKQEINNCAITNADEVEAFRIKYLGTKGIVKSIMGFMKDVPNEQKKEAGQLLNEFKLFVEAKYESLKAVSSNNQDNTSTIDNTLPGSPTLVGSRHPIN